MKKYNRYQHCDETFYTGTNIKEIICNECGTQIEHEDTIKTPEPIHNQDKIKVEEIIRQNDTE